MLSNPVIGNTVTITNVNNNLYYGLSISNAFKNRMTLTNACNNAGSNLYVGAVTYDNIVRLTNSRNSAAFGAEFISLSKDNTLIGMTTSGNASGAINHPSPGNNYLFGCTLGETTKATGFVNYGDARLQSQKQDATADSVIYTDGGTARTQNTVRHTAADVAWQLSPTSTNRNAWYPLALPIATLAVNANATVTVSCWFRRSNTGIMGALFCRGLQIAGVDDDVMATMTAAADTWEQLSISFTPTEAGVVEILALAYGGTAYSVYVDDIDYEQG
jgi:hypothetical protein